MTKPVCKQDNQFLYVEAPIYSSEYFCDYAFDEIWHDEEMLIKIVDEIKDNIKPYLQEPRVAFDYFLPSMESKTELLLSELWLSVFQICAEALYLHKFEIDLIDSMTVGSICDSEFTDLYIDATEDTWLDGSYKGNFVSRECLSQETHTKTIVLKVWVGCAKKPILSELKT